MNTSTDKVPENKSQSIANVVSETQNSRKSIVQFIDNRPEAIQLQKFQEMTTNNYKKTLSINNHSEVVQRSNTDIVQRVPEYIAAYYETGPDEHLNDHIWSSRKDDSKTCFESISDMRQCLQIALDQNQKKIEDWLWESNPADKTPLKIFGTTTFLVNMKRVANRDGNRSDQTVPTNRSEFILKKNKEGGYYALTGYPFK